MKNMHTYHKNLFNLLSVNYKTLEYVCTYMYFMLIVYFPDNNGVVVAVVVVVVLLILVGCISMNILFCYCCKRKEQHHQDNGMSACMHVCLYVHVYGYVRMYVRMDVCTYVCNTMYGRINRCMYSMCVRMCIHIHTLYDCVQCKVLAMLHMYVCTYVLYFTQIL